MKYLLKMQLDASTSTIGREERKPLMDAYMFQRRILFGCSILIGFALVIWIIAISTDHWIIISGYGGIFIPETRRFFLSSHSGLWRVCRHTTLPYAMPNSQVARNFTSIAFQSPQLINEARRSLSDLDFIQEYLRKEIDMPLENFTDVAREKMFAYWTLNDDTNFNILKESFHSIVIDKNLKQQPINAKAIIIDPLNLTALNQIFGNALISIHINDTNYNFVIPEIIQEAIFKNWNRHPSVPKLLWPYSKDLDLSPTVLNKQNVILQLVPPKPPKSGRFEHGYEYVPSRRCKYIEMFPSDDSLKTDLSVDDEIMDYIRTQASFACITVIMMVMGCVFSFYTFHNPRYMFKRLAAGIHFISASTTIVVIQVLFASNEYTKRNLLFSFPAGATLSYGYGVYLAWFVFASNLFAAVMFMWYSGKKKGSKAPTDELAMADEAIGLGR